MYQLASEFQILHMSQVLVVLQLIKGDLTGTTLFIVLQSVPPNLGKS